MRKMRPQGRHKPHSHSLYTVGLMTFTGGSKLLCHCDEIGGSNSAKLTASMNGKAGMEERH